jgi:hypothetical protein
LISEPLVKGIPSRYGTGTRQPALRGEASSVSRGSRAAEREDEEERRPPEEKAVERFGPVALERLSKEDGRALILYSTPRGDSSK